MFEESYSAKKAKKGKFVKYLIKFLRKHKYRNGEQLREEVCFKQMDEFQKSLVNEYIKGREEMIAQRRDING